MLRAMDCFSAGAVFYSPCPAGRNLGNLINYFLRGLSGYGYFNLVDFYKVSLASRDGLFFCWRGFSYSPCPAGRDLGDLIDYFPSGIIRVRVL